ncbi:MAG TPA: MarR family transcriptional regulator [Chloroflexota bacterium]|nr:MarR family transcriptional regulator [Chloroflexota bacterium]
MARRSLAQSALIEDEAPPEAVAAELVGLLPKLVRLVVAEMHAAPHTAGMTLAQFRVLARLSEREYRAAELAAALEIGRPTLTVTADCLVRRALVDRVRELPGDRRGVLLRLTPTGRALYRALEARAASALARLLGTASATERTALAIGLAALQRGLQADRMVAR